MSIDSDTESHCTLPMSQKRLFVIGMGQETVAVVQVVAQDAVLTN